MRKVILLCSVITNVCMGVWTLGWVVPTIKTSSHRIDSAMAQMNSYRAIASKAQSNVAGYKHGYEDLKFYLIWWQNKSQAKDSIIAQYDMLLKRANKALDDANNLRVWDKEVKQMYKDMMEMDTRVIRDLQQQLKQLKSGT